MGAASQASLGLMFVARLVIISNLYVFLHLLAVLMWGLPTTSAVSASQAGIAICTSLVGHCHVYNS
jgi:hypothetical protein